MVVGVVVVEDTCSMVGGTDGNGTKVSLGSIGAASAFLTSTTFCCPVKISEKDEGVTAFCSSQLISLVPKSSWPFVSVDDLLRYSGGGGLAVILEKVFQKSTQNFVRISYPYWRRIRYPKFH